MTASLGPIHTETLISATNSSGPFQLEFSCITVPDNELRNFCQFRAPNLRQCLQTCLQVRGSKDSAAMLTSIQSAGVTPEVNLRITQVRKHAEGIHPDFKTQGRRHQKFKIWVSVTKQKRLVSSKNLNKKYFASFICKSKGGNRAFQVGYFTSQTLNLKEVSLP